MSVPGRTMRSMTGVRTAVLVLAVGATVLTGCGRRNFPVAPTPEGQEPRAPAIAPGDPGPGLASSPRIVPSSSTSVAPGEVQRNPNAERRPFLLDGLLN